MHSQVIPTEASIKRPAENIDQLGEKTCADDQQQEQRAHTRRAGADSRRVGSGRARLAHPDNEVMFFLSPTNTTLTARQAGKQQQDETWQNVTTNVCLRLTATVPHNELFKVLLLKILISLCWNESSHRGVIWATFVQTDGGGKLLFGIFCTFFKHVCKMINIKKKHTDSPPVRDFVKTQFLF